MAKVKANFRVGWVKNTGSIDMTDALNEILNFYLWETPCTEVSSSGKALTEYGWAKDVWKSPKLREYLLTIANLKQGYTINSGKNVNEMSKVMESVHLNGDKFYKNTSNNKIGFLKHKRFNYILSIFYYIRCAFAHGRFSIRKTDEGINVYVFESIYKMKGDSNYTVVARIVMYEETLLKWINIIKAGPSIIDQYHLEKDSHIRDAIREMIHKETHITKKKLIDALKLSKQKLSKVIKVMKDEGQIKYDTKSGWIILD